MFRVKIIDAHNEVIFDHTWNYMPSDDAIWDTVSDSGKFRFKSDVAMATSGIKTLRDQGPIATSCELINGFQVYQFRKEDSEQAP